MKIPQQSEVCYEVTLNKFGISLEFPDLTKNKSKCFFPLYSINILCNIKWFKLKVKSINFLCVLPEIFQVGVNNICSELTE